MKRKPIRIDWDQLEAAFDSRQEDIAHYLDLVTGEVVLEGEGEEAALGEDAELEEDDRGEVVVRGDESRLYIEPPTAEQERRWMAEFVKESSDLDPALLGRLRTALDSQDFAVAFREALRAHPAARDRWFLFRAERLHQTIERWLEAHQVQYAEPPPWRS
jgi:hypothetical protein